LNKAYNEVFIVEREQEKARPTACRLAVRT